MTAPVAEPWNTPEFEGDSRGEAMVKAAIELENNPLEGERQDMNLALCRMFEGRPIQSLYQYAGQYYGSGAASYGTFDVGDVATWNVLRAVIMTAAAMIGRSSPRGRFITSAGDWRQKKRARKATQFTDGWADEADLFQVTLQALIDSLVFDYGCVQLFEENGKVKLQRVLASEITVDPMDALYGRPQTIYRRRFVSKPALRRMARASSKAKTLGSGNTLADVLQAIDEAEVVDPVATDAPSNLVCVREAWTMATGTPSTENPKKVMADGYHIIAIDATGGVLVDQAYDKTYFPLFFLRWEDARAGFSGVSLAAQLEPNQSTLNRLLYRTDKAQRLMAVPRVAIPRGSKIVKSHLTNQIGGAIEYTGNTPPSPLVWPAMPPEIYKWIDEVVQKMYDLPGINRGASSGTKEAGTESGAAIRESLDVQQTRMQIYAKRWERFHIEIYKAVIDMVSDIVEAGGNYEVAAPGTKLLERVDWKKIKLDAAEYTIQVYPVSMLPITPQGRLDFISTMLDKGLWDADRARVAMDDLDVESADSLTTAVQRMLDEDMEEMLYEGHARRPDDLTPFQQALKTAGMYLAMGKVDRAPRRNVDLIRRYVDDLKRLQLKSQASTAPAPVPVAAPVDAGPPGMAPAAAGAPMPMAA